MEHSSNNQTNEGGSAAAAGTQPSSPTHTSALEPEKNLISPDSTIGRQLKDKDMEHSSNNQPKKKKLFRKPVGAKVRRERAAARKIQALLRAYNIRKQGLLFSLRRRLRAARKIRSLVRAHNLRKQAQPEPEPEPVVQPEPEPEACGICMDATEGLVSDCGICSTKFCKTCINQHQANSPAAKGWFKPNDDGTTSTVLETYDCACCRSLSLWRRRGNTVVRKPKKTQRAPSAQCPAYIWRAGEEDMTLCDFKCSDGQFCKRHQGSVERRQAQEPIPANGDATLVGKHWAPTKQEIDDGCYKPIYHDYDTDQYYVPWFSPGETFRVAFSAQIAQIEEQEEGEFELSRFPSKRHGKVPKLLKQQFADWDPAIASYITSMRAWQV